MIKRIIPIFLLLQNDIALVYHTLVDTSADIIDCLSDTLCLGPN